MNCFQGIKFAAVDCVEIKFSGGEHTQNVKLSYTQRSGEVAEGGRIAREVPVYEATFLVSTIYRRNQWQILRDSFNICELAFTMILNKIELVS